jgi:hypothetical protein
MLKFTKPKQGKKNATFSINLKCLLQILMRSLWSSGLKIKDQTNTTYSIWSLENLQKHANHSIKLKYAELRSTSSPANS